MGRWDFGSDERLARAVIVDEYGPDAVDVLEYLARQSRADDGRRPHRDQPVITDGGERPEDCLCSGSPIERCPCFACLEAGYDDPNPNPPRADPYHE